MSTILQISTIFVDARCLQGINYSERGIGRHAQSLLRNIPSRSNSRIVGIIDPEYPSLASSISSLFDSILPSAYAASVDSKAVNPANCYLSLSPMNHDPLAHARLLSTKELLKVSIIFDFIPWRNPDRHLPQTADRIAYVTALRWLTRYDLFAPISQSVGKDLQSIVNVDSANVNVTGCPVDVAFESLRHPKRKGPKHILVIAGGDPRKNPEVVVRAHARTRLIQEQRISLVITGSYGNEEIGWFRELARSVLLVEPMLTPSTSARHFMWTGIRRF